MMRIIATGLFFCAMHFVLYAQINIPLGSSFSYLKGKDASNISTQWNSVGFDDSSWETGQAPFRYGDGTGGTVLSDMQNSYSTLYLRKQFYLSDTNGITSLNITVDYDDGFILFLNGQEISRYNAPDNPKYNSFAPENHESGTPISFSVNIDEDLLNTGLNVFAIQGFNISLTSSDFYFDMAVLAYPDYPGSAEMNFSHASGFFNDAFTLNISTPDTATLKYTLDGSHPAYSATAISKSAGFSLSIHPDNATTPGVIVRACLVKEGFHPSQPVSRTFIFTQKVLLQDAPGGDWPAEMVNDQVIDYQMDPDVVNDARYSSALPFALKDIPSVSITTDLQHFFDAEKGIYVNAEGHGREWEKACNVELFNLEDEQGFQINAGLRIRGGWSRHGYNPKHSFRLFFRSDYGSPKLNYPLFGSEGVSVFDKVDLRTAQNYAWSLDSWSGKYNSFVREVFSRDLQREMQQPYTRSRYYHLYLNGMYWGLYQTQERSEARYAETYFGDNYKDYDVVKVNTEDYSYSVEATDGNLDLWYELYEKTNQGFVNNKDYFDILGCDKNGNPKPGGQVYVDIDNLIDYMLVIFFTGNFDAPTSSFGSNKGPNNFYAIVDRDDKDKGFMFFAHDSEHSLLSEAVNVGQGLFENRVNIGDLGGENQMRVTDFYAFHPQWLHFKLTENPEYRQRFMDRAQKYFGPGGLFLPERTIPLMKNRANTISQAIIAESARWGDAMRDDPRNKEDDWEPQINMIENYLKQRPGIVVNQLKEAGLYSNISSPTLWANNKLLTGAWMNADSEAEIEIRYAATGTLYYTLDNSDPRLVGGEANPNAEQSDENVALNINHSAIIKARVKENNNWSPLREFRVYHSNNETENLKVTEVHYHPQDEWTGTDSLFSKELEFIEFKNTGNTAINLSGFVIDSAIHYTFPEDGFLAPGQFYVVAAKPSKFYQKSGFVASGNYSGSLSNGGEYVLLSNAKGEQVLAFTFDDKEPWPETPDGDGYSLVSMEVNPSGDPDNYLYWRASLYKGGSPFADDVEKTAIDEHELQKLETSLTIFPNPATEAFILKNNGNIGNAEAVITNVFGQTIYKENFAGSMHFNFAQNHLPSGVYLVTVKLAGKNMTQKVIYRPFK